MYSRPIPSNPQPTAATLPYDILREIFLHCLPDDPLSRLQANARNPPMILCYVSSYWRKVALASPSLWSHIYYRLPIRWDVEGRPIICDLEAFQTDMKILKWWRQNSGSMAPFVRFQFYQNQRLDCKESHLTGEDIKFFVEYLSSAQCLDVGPFASYLFRQDTADGFPVVCPNLHTLVAYYEDVAFEKDFGLTANPTLSRVLPFHIAPTIRRLSIHCEGDLPRVFVDTLSSWSKLTHLSMHKVAMSPNVWFSLIRAVVGLQWGYFWIAIRQDGDHNHVRPSRSTLPFLSTLSLQIYDKSNRRSELNQLSYLLQDLYLPTLYKLTIYVDVDRQNLPGDIMRINNILKSAPTVQELTLGLNFAWTIDMGAPRVDWRDVEQLSTLASGLSHLQLDMTYTRQSYRGGKLDAILSEWREILSPTRWLDLASATNAIRKITAFVSIPREHSSWVGNGMRNALWLDDEERRKKESNIRSLVEESLRYALGLDDEQRSKQASNIMFTILHGPEFDTSEKWRTWCER